MSAWRRVRVAAFAAVWLVGAREASHQLAAAPADEIRAPRRLSETGLYRPDRPGVVDDRNRPFLPQYALWSDGAAKSRWVYLPAGSTIDVTNPTDWEFPIGTKFWKEFAFAGRRIETRMLWKAAAGRWIAASYLWDGAGSDAVLAPERGVAGVAEIEPGRRHSIPSSGDCAACHGTERVRPLGFTALQLSDDRDPHAIHGEPPAPGMVVLKTLVEEGRLLPARAGFVTGPPRIATASPATRAALGYLLTNCGSCHSGEGALAAPGFAISERAVLTDGDAVVGALVGQPSRWQVPGVGDGASVLIRPGVPEESALFVRLRSRRPSSQMPPLGTVVRDQAAVEALAQWIAQLPSVDPGIRH